MTKTNQRCLVALGAWALAVLLQTALHPRVDVVVTSAAALMTGTVLAVRHGDAYELGKAVGLAVARASGPGR